MELVGQLSLTSFSPHRHATLILCIIRYGFSWITMNYYSRMAQFCYRLAFLSAAGTYGIVVYKTWRARQKTGAKQPSPIGYLADENIQYLSTLYCSLSAGRRSPADLFQ